MTSNQLLIERIKKAVSAGVKIKTLAERSGITFFRMASVVNAKSYRTCTTFTDEEVVRVNHAIDLIKKAL